ncbi:mannose-6-phosphate isomerase [Fructobacillus pseudoficulneus]|uniref:Phosphohexomutase n=1 Tax=Fructobacillus pseudoficulneus TaxID=220714 RepID=A0A3F3H4D6_9LACO|nr:mannose-6-phosphate isomerase [Fructobacillus pseudoficulneus]
MRITALEIQESADTTYRLFDFNRIDPVTQNKRDLQVQQGIDAITLTQGQQQLNQKQELIEQAVVKTLVDQPPFTLNHWSVRGKSRLTCRQPFTLLVAVAGEIDLNFNGQRLTLTAGTTLLLTPENDYYYLSGHGEFFLAWPHS